MSIRATLVASVARCTPLAMQHATFDDFRATEHATRTQQQAANPHGIRESIATLHATGLQLAEEIDATRGELLHVARPSECNTQLGGLTAHRVTADLLKAAMHVCDRYEDSDAAREAMRVQVMETPQEQRADLLEHFQTTYGVPV